MANIKVELRPYVGTAIRRGKARETQLPQKRVYLLETDDEGNEIKTYCGIVSDIPGSRFCSRLPLSEYDDAELALIHSTIADFHGQAPPPPVGVPKTIVEQTDADDSGLDEPAEVVSGSMPDELS
jgi:hypothetical protein